MKVYLSKFINKSALTDNEKGGDVIQRKIVSLDNFPAKDIKAYELATYIFKSRNHA